MASTKKESFSHREPSADVRRKVEASMSVMIDHLAQQGLNRAEVALALADAAENYVIDLANGDNNDPEDNL